MTTNADSLRKMLKTCPYDLLVSEMASRNAGKRKTHGGPTQKLAPCPKCGKIMGTRARRKACPAH